MSCFGPKRKELLFTVGTLVTLGTAHAAIAKSMARDILTSPSDPKDQEKPVTFKHIYGKYPRG